MRKREYSKGLRRKPVEPRFWQKVDQRGPDECWPWLGGSNASGYGYISVGGRMRHATHVSMEIATGQPFPVGMMACHSCDNPPCVNPAHLWVGSAKENMKDASVKGRLTGRGQGPKPLVKLLCETV